MATGIELYTASGVKYFSTETTTWSYIGSFIAVGGRSTSVNFPSIVLMGEVIFQRSIVDNLPVNQEATVHNVYRNGTLVTAQDGAVRTLIIVLGR